MREIVMEYLAELVVFLIISLILYVVNYICGLIRLYKYQKKKKQDRDNPNIKKSGFQQMLDKQLREAEKARKNGRPTR